MANTVKKPLLYEGDKIIFTNTFIKTAEGFPFPVSTVELIGIIETPEGKILEVKRGNQKTPQN